VRRALARPWKESGVTEAGTIRVQLNGKPREIDRGHTVRSLLETLDLQPGMVVVELNRDILERDSYENFDVSEGDTIELVHFVGGG
jgi:thiamine biosynthesis protein ThiS